MKHSLIGLTLGIMIAMVGVAELIPALIDFAHGHNNADDFFRCAVVSIFFGGGLIIVNSGGKPHLSLRQSFLLTTLSWVCLSVTAAMPLYFSDLDLSFTDAVFESVSGVTTTGSTVLSGLDEQSHGVLLWRSIIQWIGGIGIIAFAIVILPFLSIGGMQLFQTESSDKSDKALPKTTDLVSALVQIYGLLTLLCVITYYALGMDFFDAVNHAMTTLSTGGYSTHDASFGYFKSPAMQYAASLFMLAGSIPFVLYVRFLYQGRFLFFKDEQFMALVYTLVALTVVLSVWLWASSPYSISESVQYSVFNIISVITTTGYATTDYTLWGGFAVAFFFFLTFLGACSGSTSGGIKMMRIVIVSKILRRQIKKLIYPNGTFSIRYQGRNIDNAVALNVMAFLGLFCASNVVLSVLLALLGLDFETAISGAATALANVGPGIGNVIGPAGNFASLPDTAKWLLCAGMILGRLEIMTIFVLFRREYWRG
ncbi:MAG: TrkH family potassium uptake protein [Bdellovibrionales bacterium]